MRRFLAIALSAAALHVFAQENFSVTLMDVQDAHGSRLQFRTDTNTLLGTPAWTPGSQDPPLSTVAATKIAVEAGKRRLPKADDIAVDSITLRRAGGVGSVAGHLEPFTRWYYVFDVSPIIAGETFTGQSATTIVVLFSGAVVEPQPVK